MTRRDILEAASLLPANELAHVMHRARLDYQGAALWLSMHLPESVGGRQGHSDTFLRGRVAVKLGQEGLTAWEEFVRLVDSQPKAWRYPAPEEGEM